MTAAKIVIGIVFVVMATVVYGDAHQNQRCAEYQPDWETWWDNAPSECRTWSGCDTSDQEGRCTGPISAEVDDVSSAYIVMSCETISSGCVYKCKDFVDVKCVDNGTSTCLQYKVYANTNCIEDGTPTAEWSKSTYNCYTDSSGG